jgi:hypothetical protein
MSIGLAASAASGLIATGLMTNFVEEAALHDSKTYQKIGNGIMTGVEPYVETRVAVLEAQIAILEARVAALEARL